MVTSMESRSSLLKVPSAREVLMKSIMESARRCFLVIAIFSVLMRLVEKSAS